LQNSLSGAGRDVRVTGFQGLLSSTATIQSLTIADDAGIWLTLEGVTLDWNRSALLAGGCRSTRSPRTGSSSTACPRARRTRRCPRPKPRASACPSFPCRPHRRDRLPLHLHRRAGVRHRQHLLPRGGPDARRRGGQRDDRHRQARRPEGNFEIAAAFSNATGILDLDVTLQEAPGGIVATLAGFPGEPSVDLDVTGQGPLTELRGDAGACHWRRTPAAGSLAIGGEGLAPGDPRPFRAGSVGQRGAPSHARLPGLLRHRHHARRRGTRGADGALDLDTFRLTGQSITLDGSLALGTGRPAAELRPRRAYRGGRRRARPPPDSGQETRVDAVTLTAAFDAASGNSWQGLFRIDGLDRPGFTAEELTLDGGGTITPASFTVDLDFTAEALDLGDPAAVAALGERVTGRIVFGSTEGQPLQIDRFDLTGESYTLESSGTLDIADRDLAIDGQARVAASDLSVFSGIAQRPLVARQS
jgi:translocation and assembly module TamB